jgi:hypothetical protein
VGGRRERQVGDLGLVHERVWDQASFSDGRFVAPLVTRRDADRLYGQGRTGRDPDLRPLDGRRGCGEPDEPRTGESFEHRLVTRRVSDRFPDGRAA